jgi:hypothetical protein
MSNYRLVTRAFPTDYWEAHGDEILDTANELHDGGWSARESRSLLAHGLRTRSLAATGGSVRQMWAQCAAFALTWLVLQVTATATAILLGVVPTELLQAGMELQDAPWPAFAAAGAVVLALLCRSTRWAPLVPAFLAVLALTNSETTGRPGLSFLLIVSSLAAWIAWKRDVRPMLGLRLAVALALLHIVGLSFGVFGLGLLPLLALPLGLLSVVLEPRVLGVAAIEVLFILGTVVASIDDTPRGELAVVFAVVTTVLVAATALASFGNRRLRQTT